MGPHIVAPRARVKDHTVVSPVAEIRYLTSAGRTSPENIVIVRGVARSKYARSAPMYEQNVKQAARESFDAPLSSKDLSVDVRHFYTSGHAIDLDNLLKNSTSRNL